MMKNAALPTSSINLKSITIYMLIGLTLGILVSFLGIYSIGLVTIVFALYGIFKVNLNGLTTIFLTTAVLYVNFLRPLNGFEYFPIMIDIFMFVLVVKYLFSKEIGKEKIFWIVVVSSFVVISFLQIFNPNIPSVMAGIEGFRKTSLPFLFFYVGLLAFKNVKEVKSFIISFSLISMPILLYGIKQYLFPTNFDMLYIKANDADMYTGTFFGKVRATSVFAGPFHFGMFSAVLAVFNLFLIDIVKKKRYKFYFFLQFLVSVVACYSSLTRTNLIALFVALLLYKILFMDVKKLFIILSVISVCFITSINFIILYSQKLIYSSNDLLRMIGTIANFNEDSRLLGRIHGWETILYLIKQQPITAYGTGSAGDTLQNTYDFQYHVTSHNFFLKVFMETGLFGFIIILLLFTMITITLLKRITIETNIFNKKLLICCFSVFSIFLVNTVVGSTIETYPVSGFILLMLGLALIKFGKLGHLEIDQ